MEAGLRWLYILIVSAGVTFFLTHCCSWLARRLGVMDAPDARKTHGSSTPLLGGAAVFAGFLAGLGANAIYAPELGLMGAAAGLLFCVGLLDDARDVSARAKLLAQVIATAMVMAGGIALHTLPDNWGAPGVVGNGLLTMAWIIGITNAFNFFDGMDGLAAGVGAIIAFFLGVTAFQTNQAFLGWIAVAMMGACLGFLPHNFRFHGRAHIFLGDAGSTVIGFILACLAVYGDWAPRDPLVSLAAPILIFWPLVFDMIHITVDRIATGKVRSLHQWLAYVGRDHLHHRLARAVGGEKRSVLFIYLLTFCLGVGAVILRGADRLNAALLLTQAVLIVGLVTFLERGGCRANGQNGHCPDDPRVRGASRDGG